MPPIDREKCENVFEGEKPVTFIASWREKILAFDWIWALSETIAIEWICCVF